MLEFKEIKQSDLQDYSAFQFFTFQNVNGSAYAIYIHFYDYDYSTNTRQQPDYIGYKVTADNMLTVTYLHGKCCINLDRGLPCSKADFNRILEFLNRADSKEADRAAGFIHAYFASRINECSEQRNNHKSDYAYDKQKRKEFTADIKKYIALNDQLASVYHVPALTDPEQEQTEAVKMKKDFSFTFGMVNGIPTIRRFDGFSFILHGYKFTVHKQYKQYVVTLAENGLKLCTADKKTDCIAETERMFSRFEQIAKEQPEKMTEYREQFVSAWNNNPILLTDSNLVTVGKMTAEPITETAATAETASVNDQPETEKKTAAKAAKKPCKRSKAVKSTEHKQSRKSRSKAVTEPETERKTEPECKPDNSAVTPKKEPENSAAVNQNAEPETKAEPENVRNDQPCNDDVKEFMHRYYAVYQALYDAVDYMDIYQDSVKSFDQLSAEKTDAAFNALLEKFIQARHDFISSDREAAAFYIAYCQEKKERSEAEKQKQTTEQMQRSGIQKKENNTGIAAEMQNALMHDPDSRMQKVVRAYKRGMITYDEMITELIRTKNLIDAEQTEETEAAAFARYDDFTDRLKYWHSKGLITWDELKKELIEWHLRNVQFEQMIAEQDAEKTAETEAVTAPAKEKNQAHVTSRSRRTKRTVKKKIGSATMQKIDISRTDCNYIDKEKSSKGSGCNAESEAYTEKSIGMISRKKKLHTLSERQPDYIDTS